MGGCIEARHNLGATDDNACNVDRASKRYMIAAGGGRAESLKMIQKLYSMEWQQKIITQMHYEFIKYIWKR